MSEEFLAAVLATPVQSLFFVMSLSLVRPIGLLFGFLAFTWGLGTAFTVRSGIAFAFAIPIMLGDFEAISRVARESSSIDFAFMSAKEFAIGYGFGFLISLPGLVFQYAGAVTDTYRGESDSGISSPNGGTLPTTSMLYLCVGYFIYFSEGGLWVAMSAFYGTYVSWPIDQLLPPLSQAAPLIALGIMDSIMWHAFLLALPLLLIMMSIDFVLATGAKLAQRFGIFDLSFPLKNLAMILLMPLLCIAFVRYVPSENVLRISPVEFIERVLK